MAQLKPDQPRPRRRQSRGFPFRWLLAGLALALSAASGWADEGGFGPKGQPMRAVWRDNALYALVMPLPDEGYIQIARRVMETPDPELLAKTNKNRPVMKGRWVLAPAVALTPALKGEALKSLYPEDELTENGWAHRVTDPLETMIQLAQLYTGGSMNYLELAQLNHIKRPDHLELGAIITIPLHKIPQALGFHPQVKPPLTLEKDQNGDFFALYTLKPRETLYSSVVIRFTGRETAEEVNRLAKKLMQLNGLASAKAIPAGKTVKIPLEWLSEEYLEQKRALPVAQKPPPPKKAPRSGRPFHVIIDPGHGGVDVGAVYGSVKKGDRVYEDEVVYDIALRLGELLKKQGTQVHFTLRDPDQSQPAGQLSAKPDRDEEVRVTPPYQVRDVDVGVNMRVYLIDALYRKLRQSKVRPEEILFLSIHADALHPSLRGAMVYYPDHRLRQRDFGLKSRVYRIRHEAQPATIHFREDDNRYAAALSGDFAHNLVERLKNRQVAVGRRKAVRSFYYRQGERTLPGVLRYSRVPTSVLVEVANLNNSKDRKAVLNPLTRQAIAQGLADAVKSRQQGATRMAAMR